VIALDVEENLILVRQYRFGTESFTLEIPGGVLEPGETPEQGCVRELREETGYVGDTIVKLGVVEPNPALQNNRCTTFLITGCRPESVQDLDPGEDVTVELHSVEQLGQMIRSGAVTHSLVVAALGLYRLHADEVARS
jgi:8-oxo-dGTP pyrophosphatase MutT (NUDIX family)